VSGQDCALMDGFYLGDGTECDPNPCIDPFGACCDPDHTCHIRTPDDCTSIGGDYQGDYVSCEEETCGEPVGACCLADGLCLLLTEGQCNEYSGAWLGAGVPCDPNPCPAAPRRRVPAEAQAYYLILDTRVDDTGGPWMLDYSIRRPSDVAESEIERCAADLIGNAPNPFVGSTRIFYRLAHPGSIRLEIFDVGGKVVRCLVNGVAPDGGTAEWDGRDDQGNRVPAGVYFARLNAEGFTTSRPVIRLE